MKKRNNINQKGFTLLEVVMAGAILTIGVLVGISAAKMNSQNLSYDQQEITATEIATTLLETMTNSYASTDPNLVAGAHIQYYNAQEQVVLATANPIFTVTWTITDDVPVTGFMTINLQVQWGTGSQLKNVSFQTYRTD